MLGKRIVRTAEGGTIQVPAANAVAALEVMSRFAINPKWLIDLSPTISPCETSSRQGLLGYPNEAFAYFVKEGVQRVVVEEKHMGSRALAVLCRDGNTAPERFGVTSIETGALFTRTGRSFFSEAEMSDALLARIRAAMDAADFWDRFETGWARLDTKLMAWSATAVLDEAVARLEKAGKAGLETTDFLAEFMERNARADQYV